MTGVLHRFSSLTGRPQRYHDKQGINPVAMNTPGSPRDDGVDQASGPDMTNNSGSDPALASQTAQPSSTPAPDPIVPKHIAKQMKLRKFSGDGYESYDEWMRGFNLLVKVQKIPREQHGKCIIALLEGQALEWAEIQGFPDDFPTDVVENALAEQFGLKCRAIMALELFNMKIGKDEPVAEFMRRIHRALAVIYKNLCTEDHFTQLTAVLSNGLRDHPVFYPMMPFVYKAETVTEIQRILQGAEDGHTFFKQADNRPPPVDPEAMPLEPTQTASVTALTQTYEHHHVTDYKESVDSQAIAHDRNPARQCRDPWAANFPSHDTEGNRICNYCGNPGHIKLHCPLWINLFGRNSEVVHKLMSAGYTQAPDGSFSRTGKPKRKNT